MGYRPSWFPRRYCKKAATKRPSNVTGIRPRIIPESKGSTIVLIN